LIHIHGINTAISEKVISYSQKHGARIVLTFHLQPFCQRGTLLQYGKYSCTGEYDIRKCLPCILHDKGFSEFQSKLASQVILHMPPAVSQSVKGKWNTALRLPGASQEQHRRLLLACENSDKIVALSYWQKNLYITNSVPEEKIALVRHGTRLAKSSKNISDTQDNCAPFFRKIDGLLNRGEYPHQEIKYPIRLIFLGRIVPVKGLHLVIDAIAHLPKDFIKLDVFGSKDMDFSDYYDQITDNLPSNVQFQPVIPPEVAVSASNTARSSGGAFTAISCTGLSFCLV